MVSSISTPSMLDGCDDTCGYIFAFVACLAYGSFGVPIKATVASLDNVHPLVFQSYKTLTMFLTCWLVLLLGVQPSFTYWGLLSGTLWVFGGTGGIYAIRNAGMAIAVGTWASVMICVNFFWGIIIFKEPVANVSGTIGAFVLLGLGLVGMSKFSSAQQRKDDEDNNINDEIEQEQQQEVTAEMEVSLMHQEQQQEHSSSSSAPRVAEVRRRGELIVEDQAPEAREQPMDDHDRDGALSPLIREEMVVLSCFGMNVEISRRTAGILGAVFNGLMTGSSLIPIHYAKQQGFGGAHYMISYAVGASIANIVLWNIYFIFMCIRQAATIVMSSYSTSVVVGGGAGDDNDERRASTRRLSISDIVNQAWKSMPLWHVRQLLVPGFIAGSLLSLAMFGSILSVTYLGQAVGNSIIQAKILVSGLWGIAWYKEVKGCYTITSWFASASLAVLGILWLSHERLAAKTADGGGGDDGPNDYEHMLLL